MPSKIKYKTYNNIFAAEIYNDIKWAIFYFP